MAGLALVLLLGLVAAVHGALDLSGVNFLNGQWSTPKFDSATGLASMDEAVSQVGAPFVTFSFAWFQDNITTTQIYRKDVSPTDDALRTAVRHAQAGGKRVLLRPLVDPNWALNGTSGTWRGEIGTGFGAEQWDAWFASYTDFIIQYARLAASLDVDIFSVGAELIEASKQQAHWETLCAQVRNVTGTAMQLTYGANHGNEASVAWWSSVDIIGIDAYYTVPVPVAVPTVAELVLGWSVVHASLGKLAARENRPIFFTEIGFCSKAFTQLDPAHCNERHSGISLAAQTNNFVALMKAFGDAPWFRGFHVWAWTTDPAPPASSGSWANDTGFSPRGKPAAAAIRERLAAETGGGRGIGDK